MSTKPIILNNINLNVNWFSEILSTLISCNVIDKQIKGLIALFLRWNELIYRLFSECHRQLWTNYDFTTLASNLRNIICTNPSINECHLVKYDKKFDDLLAHRLQDTGTYLGRVNQQERDLLFSDSTQSTALYLIGNTKHPVAILAFGSDDVNHFEPAKDSFFVLDFVRSLQLRLLELAWVRKLRQTQTS